MANSETVRQIVDLLQSETEKAEQEASELYAAWQKADAAAREQKAFLEHIDKFDGLAVAQPPLPLVVPEIALPLETPAESPFEAPVISLGEPLKETHGEQPPKPPLMEAVKDVLRKHSSIDIPSLMSKVRESHAGVSNDSVKRTVSVLQSQGKCAWLWPNTVTSKIYDAKMAAEGNRTNGTETSSVEGMTQKQFVLSLLPKTGQFRAAEIVEKALRLRPDMKKNPVQVLVSRMARGKNAPCRRVGLGVYEVLPGAGVNA